MMSTKDSNSGSMTGPQTTKKRSFDAFTISTLGDGKSDSEDSSTSRSDVCSRSGMDVLLEALEYRSTEMPSDMRPCKTARMSTPGSDCGDESFTTMSVGSPPPLLVPAIPSSPNRIPSTAASAGLGISPSASDFPAQQQTGSKDSLPLFFSSQPIRIRCWTPRLAIKSYGSEKRFLYPPPKIEFNPTDVDVLRSAQSLSLSLVSDSGQCIMGQTVDMLTLPIEQNELLFRHFHIPSGQPARNFRLELKASDKVMLHTKPITTISKPSKKSSNHRQTTLVIRSGDLIALHNRINGQTVRTKHIMIDSRNNFSVSVSNWSQLRIERSIANSKAGDEKPPSILYFGDTVKLVAVDGPSTNSAIGTFIIHRVDRNVLVPHAGPVCQMHRVAFEQIDNTSGEPTGRLWSIVSVDSCSARLEFTEDYRQTLRKDSYCSSNNNPVIVQDSSCWCLVGVAESFVELNPLHAGPNGAQLTRFPTDIDLPVISHCPQVDFDRNVLNLQGINLLYSVWCGDIGPLLPLNGAAVDGCSLNLLLPNKQLLIEHFRAKQQHHDEDSLNSALVSKDQICSLPIWFALLCPSQGPIAVYTGQKIDLPI